MSVPAGLTVVASILLVVGGAVKAARPSTTARALHVWAPIVRAGAAVELAIGLAALATGSSAAAALVATSYVGFALFVSWALWRGAPLATCGCFGEPNSPPTLLHIVINASLAAGAATTAITGEGRSIVHLGPAAVVGACVVAYVTFLSLTSLARTQALIR